LLLIFLGFWFLVRNEQRFPMLSTERMLGVISLYLDILTWVHWFSGGGWDLAEAGLGGGYLGGFFERILVVTLGDAGAVVVMTAWLLLGLAFTFDLSIPDLFRRMSKPAVKTGEFITEKTTKIVEPHKENGEPEKSKRGGSLSTVMDIRKASLRSITNRLKR
jgi:S-DNA-T family DNA segregation ATPase FtsK/SpoIIIE